MMDNHIARKLKALRKANNYTTQELADKVNVSQSYISRFENGRAVPDVDMLERILHALDSNLPSFFSSEMDELPEDLIQLIHTLKTLSPEARRKLNEFISLVQEDHNGT